MISYLVCLNKLKFPSANEMCCSQCLVDITMAELPTMPFTWGDFCMQISVNLQSGRFEKKSPTGGVIQPHNFTTTDLLLQQILYKRA